MSCDFFERSGELNEKDSNDELFSKAARMGRVNVDAAWRTHCD